MTREEKLVVQSSTKAVYKRLLRELEAFKLDVGGAKMGEVVMGLLR